MSKLRSITIADNELYLRQISEPVVLSDKNLAQDIAVLEEYCNEHEVMAMAGVQLGIPKRLIYLKNTNLEIINKIQAGRASLEEQSYNEGKVLINPVIMSREGLTEYWEGCESCLDNIGLVKRPYKIRVEYYDITGNKHSDVFEGISATVLSHEVDHLDGVLHIDIADEIIVMTPEEKKAFRQTHGYNIITKTGQYEDLLKSSSNVRKGIKTI